MNRVTIISLVCTAALFVYIVEMVRRRKLREEYSILWLIGCGLIVVLSLKKEWLDHLAKAVGIYYAPSLLFLVGMTFVLLILIHFSMTISKLFKMNKQMAQQIALMRAEREARTDSSTGNET